MDKEAFDMSEGGMGWVLSVVVVVLLSIRLIHCYYDALRHRSSRYSAVMVAPKHETRGIKV